MPELALMAGHDGAAPASATAATPKDTQPSARAQIICLTPVKNEAWILERFLRSASLWADRIIIADQGSEDGSREIARSFPKVDLIENGTRVFNEPERQKLLLDAARQIPGPKLLIALDADECLTANFSTSAEWELLQRVTPGTIINFQLANVLPDRKSYYLYPADFSFGYMDDGAPHGGPQIHSPRLPRPAEHAVLSLREIKVLHFATMARERFESRIRWYQCWELIHNKSRNGRWDGSLTELYRIYHRDLFVSPQLIKPLPDAWTAGYDANLLNVPIQAHYRWDAEILGMFAAHGTKAFRKLAVWSVDWEEMHKRIHGTPAPTSLRDPRSRFERGVHKWLERTQPWYSHGSPPSPFFPRFTRRVLERGLSLLGW